MSKKSSQVRFCNGELIADKKPQPQEENPCDGCDGDCYTCEKRPSWKLGYINSMSLKRIYGRPWKEETKACELKIEGCNPRVLELLKADAELDILKLTRNDQTIARKLVGTISRSNVVTVLVDWLQKHKEGLDKKTIQALLAEVAMPNSVVIRKLLGTITEDHIHTALFNWLTTPREDIDQKTLDILLQEVKEQEIDYRIKR
jgi:hypothetical protein